MNKRVKLILLALLALAISLIVYTGVNYWRHRDLAKITIYVMPEDSNIKIDGQDTSKHSLYIAPGEHKFEASKDGFITDKGSIVATKKGPNDIYLTPTPQSAEALKWAADHPELEALRIQYAQINEAKRQAELKKRYPFLKYLPLETARYTITYGPSEKFPDDESAVTIYITAPSQTRKLALDWIKFRGGDPATLDIVYQDPT